MPPKASKRKAANGYRLPDPLPEGLVFTDILRKTWRLGKSIGVGGFGEIYLCIEDKGHPVGDDAAFVVKIEPQENGPLFVEMNFYIRAAKPPMVNEFKSAKGLRDLGMPTYQGSGRLVHKGETYRFLVIERFGKDLQKIFLTGKKLFPAKATYNLAIKMLDVIEYIHYRGYVHNDLKAQNILLGHGRTKENDAFLVDFGLVTKYVHDGVHKEYKPDARKAHDGTIEYTSRDAHIGAHSRRSDLEILGYNLVHWMSGTLPWMDNLTDCQYVHLQKKGFMSDIPKFLRCCFGENDYPDVLEEFMTYVTGLGFEVKPDYDACREMFRQALKDLKLPLDGKIDFSNAKSPTKKNRKRKHSVVDDVHAPQYRKSARTTSRPGVLTDQSNRNGVHPTPATSPSPPEEALIDSAAGALSRSDQSHMDMENWNWEQVLCSDPEMLIRQASRQSETEDSDPLSIQRRAVEERKQAESLKNPTPAMMEILRRIQEREKEREQLSWHQQLQLLQGRKAAKAITWDLTPNPLTPAMEEVIAMRSKRVSVEIDIPITPEPSDVDSSSSDDDDDLEYVPPSARKKVKEAKKVLPARNKSPVRKSLEFVDEQTLENAHLLAATSKAIDANNPFLTLIRDQQSIMQQIENEQKGRQSRSTVAKVPAGRAVPKVSVQNQLDTPEKIRNKSSPVKEFLKRRISIQNDADLIRNRETTVTKRQVKIKDRFITKKNGSKGSRAVKSLSEIPEEFEISKEQLAVTTPKEAEKVIKKRGRTKRKVNNEKPEMSPQIVPTKKGVQKAKGRHVELTEAAPEVTPRRSLRSSKAEQTPSEPKEVIEDEVFESPLPPPKSKGKVKRKGSVASVEPIKTTVMTSPMTSPGKRSTRSSDGSRSTRGQEFDWTKVINSDPEKMLRMKK